MPVSKKNVVYIWSLRNGAADKAGRFVTYKDEPRYMMSPLEYLVAQLNDTSLGERYCLAGIIHDDDEQSARDKHKLGDYGFAPGEGANWLFPTDMAVQGRRVSELMISIPSSYRQQALDAPGRVAGKRAFENNLQAKLLELNADLVVLDGLLIILDELVRPNSIFHRKIVNIHPGITRLESPYERRGAYATWDALYGAKGQRVVDWQTMTTQAVAPVLKTGASFHYVDEGIDSGEVIIDVLNTDIDPEDSIFELRWNNFQRSLFPALIQGLDIMADVESPVATTIDGVA